MFIDEAKIYVKAGDGGAGCVSFRREKHVPHGGPDGGDGGNGGSVIIAVNPHMRTLLDFQYQQHYRARRGQHGMGKKMYGRRGTDKIIYVPLGTTILDEDSGQVLADFTDPNMTVIVANGGKGGRGNVHFVSATNRAPREWDVGGPGQERWLKLELKLIADFGLVGFPNAGKSTLLSRITAARPKIADYPFTTLAPNLGIIDYKGVQQFVVADIPGLIEGAHLGKGLGIKFLRHIERTRVLVVLLECLSKDILADYQVLLHELSAYSPALAQKQKMVAITKMDLAAPDLDLAAITDQLKVPGVVISAVTGAGLAELQELMIKILAKLDEGDEN